MRFWRYLVWLAVFLAAFAWFEGRRRAAPPAVPAATGADRAAGVKAVTTSPEPLPEWTKRKPEIVTEGARRVAHAVGSAHAGDLALSRAAAEDRARYELARLVDGRASVVGSEVTVNGARVVQTYSAADGTVYVELAAPVHR